MAWPTSIFYAPSLFEGRRKIRALQVRTIEELLHGNGSDFPLTGSNVTFKQGQTETVGETLSMDR